MEPTAPHELLEQCVVARLGRRADALGPLREQLLLPLVTGLADQLSAYLDCRPMAELKVGRVQLREGEERTYLLAPFTDRGEPLRMRGVMEGRWDATLVTSRIEDWVEAQNARRWRFADRYRHLLADLFSQLADAAIDYYARKPGARLEVAADAMPRLLEGTDATWLSLELDDRGTPSPQAPLRRYQVP